MGGQEIRRQLIRGLKSVGPPQRGGQMGYTKAGEELGKNRESSEQTGGSSWNTQCW